MTDTKILSRIAHNTLKASKSQQIVQAKNSEQPQSVSAVQSCPNKKWIDLYYKYAADRPVSGAAYKVFDQNGMVVANGRLDARGFAHVTGLPDNLTTVTVCYTGDPKEFEIFNDKKPFKNPYYDLPPKLQSDAPPKQPAAEPGLLMQGAVKAAQMYVAYEEMKATTLEWGWGAIQGDWNDDQTYGQIIFDTAVSMIPVVDQAADFRDVSANLYKLTCTEKYKEFGPWFGFVMSLIGLFPELGSAIKGAVKSLLRVGKNAATVTIKEGVKFAEHLLIRSGVDIGSFISIMNHYGEGNVIKWLRKLAQDFAPYKRFVIVMGNKILRDIKRKLLKLQKTVTEALAKKIERVATNIDEVMRRLADNVEEIMEHIRKEFERIAQEAEDYTVKGVTNTQNGARQIAEHAPVPPTAPLPHGAPHSIHPHIDPEKLKKLAQRAGMEPHELEGAIAHCTQEHERVVVRFTNEKSLQWHGQPNHVPKNIDVKLKTAKSGPTAGLVVRPREPMEEWEIANIDALHAKGYEFDAEDCLRDNKGNRIYGDYDLQSVQSLDPATGKYTAVDVDGAKVKEINNSMRRDGGRMIEPRGAVEHGSEERFFVKTQLVPEKDTLGKVITDAEGNPVMKREIVYEHAPLEEGSVAGKKGMIPDPNRKEDLVYDAATGQAVKMDASKGKPVMATEKDYLEGNAVLGRQHGDDEKYLVINPDGSVHVLENPHELYELDKKSGVPWRYDSAPPTGEELAIAQAKKKAKKEAMEKMAAAEAKAQQAQMEKHIDELIGDGKQFGDLPPDKSGGASFWEQGSAWNTSYNSIPATNQNNAVFGPANLEVPWGL